MSHPFLVSGLVLAAAVAALVHQARRVAPAQAAVTLTAPVRQCVRTVGAAAAYRLENSCDQCVRVTVVLGDGAHAVESMHTIEARSIATLPQAVMRDVAMPAGAPRLVAEARCDPPA
jgi:hypothetical protein